MQEVCIYQVEVQGQMDEQTLSASGPLRIKVIQSNPAATRLEVYADQSGLIGVLRYLHQQGFVLLCACRK